MKNNAYTIKGSSPGTLPPLLGTEALREASEGDLRVLIALCELGSADAKKLATLLSEEETAVAAALAFWRGAGYITTSGTPDAPTPPRRRLAADELRELGAEELSEYIREGGLAALITAVEQQRGRLLNRADLSVLVGMTEELGLDEAYLLTLLAFCDAGGDGSPKSLRYAERVALRLAEHGITTCAALEAYIREQEALHSVEGGLRRMFGIGARRLTEKESRAFLTWTDTYGYGEEVIGAAYDVTVGATGKASVAYADKILAHWHEAGIKTAEEAAALLERERSEKKPAQRTGNPKKRENLGSSFDIGDFFQRAVDRSFKTETAADDGEH